MYKIFSTTDIKCTLVVKLLYFKAKLRRGALCISYCCGLVHIVLATLRGV